MFVCFPRQAIKNSWSFSQHVAYSSPATAHNLHKTEFCALEYPWVSLDKRDSDVTLQFLLTEFPDLLENLIACYERLKRIFKIYDMCIKLYATDAQIYDDIVTKY